MSHKDTVVMILAWSQVEELHSFPSSFKFPWVGSLWYGRGHPYSHLRLVVVDSTLDASHLDTNASQILKTINIIAAYKIDRPMVDMVFCVVYVSE